MVVYGFVGETPGICWMQAVNRKNKLAYFENCSGNGPTLENGRAKSELVARA